MRRALLDDHLWIGGDDATGGVLICLRSGRIIGTVERNGAGWRGRAFVSPIRLLEAWWEGVFRYFHFSIETTRRGLAIVSRHRDRDWVQQDVELLASVDEDVDEF